MKAPDSITPIIAYREFRIAANRPTVHLVSSAVGRTILPPPIGVPGERIFLTGPIYAHKEFTPGWNTAFCALHLFKGDRHFAPTRHCTCGFYARDVLDDARIFRLREDDLRVLAQVELAGKVIVHERGYRAEKLRILQLVHFETKDHQADADKLVMLEHLAAYYDCGVATVPLKRLTLRTAVNVILDAVPFNWMRYWNYPTELRSQRMIGVEYA